MALGRDLILELSPRTAGDLVLQALRRERDAQCPAPGGVLTPNWPTAVTFDPARGVGSALVTAITAAGAVTLPIPIARYLDRDRIVGDSGLQPLLDRFDAEVNAIGGRALSSGAVAVGVDLTGGLRSSDPEWQSFDRDFLTVGGAQRDWAIGIDRAFLEAALVRRLEALIAPFRGDLPEGSRVRRPRVTWGNPVRVVLDVEIEIPGINAGGIIHVDVLLRLDAQRRLVLDIARVNVDLTGIANLVDVGPVNDDIDDAVLGVLRRELARIFSPVSIDLTLGPLATLRAEVLRVTDQGLFIAGSALVIVPAAPELSVTPSPVLFTEDAASACAGGPTPAFGSRDVSIQNGASGTLFICKVEVEGDGFSIAGSAAPPPAGVSSGGAFPLRIAYAGPRRDATGRLRVYSNDPARPIATFPLRVLAEGRPELRYSPDPLELRVANTRSGSYVEDDFNAEPCQPWLRQRSIREAPAGFITISNVGQGPGYICRALVEDHSGTFDVDPIGPYQLLPGESVQVGVRYFPYAVGVDDYTFVDIDTPDGTHAVSVHGRVDPSRQSVGLDVPGINGRIRHGIDLIGEIACSAPPLHRCAARGLFEPSRGPQFDSVDIGPVRPGGRVELLAADGERVGWESFDGRQARLWDEWVDDPGFRGNWCIARLSDVPALELAAVHMALGSWTLSPLGRLDAPGVRAIAAAGSWLYVADRDAVRIVDWRDPARPVESGRLALPAASLAVNGSTLAVAVGDEVLLHEIDAQGGLRLAGALQAGGEVTLVRPLGPSFVLATKHGIVTEHCRLELPAGPHALGAIGSSLVALSPAGVALIGAPRPGELRVLDADRSLGSAEVVSTVGGRVHVVSKHQTRIFSARGELRCVGERSHAVRPRRIETQGPDAIYELDAEGVRRWRLSKRKLERARFEAAFELRYRPERRAAR